MKRPEGKYAWTVTVGTKGQIVIPKEALTYLTFIREIISSSLLMPNRAWRSLRRIFEEYFKKVFH